MQPYFNPVLTSTESSCDRTVSNLDSKIKLAQKKQSPLREWKQVQPSNYTRGLWGTAGPVFRASYILNSWCGKRHYSALTGTVSWHGDKRMRERDDNTSTESLCLFDSTNTVFEEKTKLFVFNKTSIVCILIWSGMFVGPLITTTQQKTPVSEVDSGRMLLKVQGALDKLL